MRVLWQNDHIFIEEERMCYSSGHAEKQAVKRAQMHGRFIAGKQELVSQN